MINQILHPLAQKLINPQRDPSQKLQLVGQMAVIGRKFKQISSAKLSNWQWFLLLYVAGTGALLLLVTLLKVAMKLI